MANHNHNQNGRNVSQPDENRPSWRPQDQNQGRDSARGDDERMQPMQRDDRDRGERWGSSGSSGSRMGANWEDDRDEGYRGTERYGQGQSGYGGGRHEDDRSWSTRNQAGGYEDRGRGAQTDDRWSGRGGQGFYESRGGMGDHRDRGRTDVGGDFDADLGDYNSGYNQGAMGYGGYGMSGPQQGMGAQGFKGGSGGAQRMRDESQGRIGGQDRGMSDGRWGQGRTGYGPSAGYNEGGMGGDGRNMMGRGSSASGLPYGQGHQGMGNTQGQGFGQTGGTYGQQRGAGHRGKGPMGWQRSDERIKDTICELLHDDDDIDASQIDVKVQGGEVTLSGSVADRQMKRAAEELVERCSGVKDVQNTLRVGAAPGGASSTGNGSTTSGAKNETDRVAPEKTHRA